LDPPRDGDLDGDDYPLCAFGSGDFDLITLIPAIDFFMSACIFVTQSG